MRITGKIQLPAPDAAKTPVRHPKKEMNARKTIPFLRLKKVKEQRCLSCKIRPPCNLFKKTFCTNSCKEDKKDKEIPSNSQRMNTILQKTLKFKMFWLFLRFL